MAVQPRRSHLASAPPHSGEPPCRSPDLFQHAVPAGRLRVRRSRRRRCEQRRPNAAHHRFQRSVSAAQGGYVPIGGVAVPCDGTAAGPAEAPLPALRGHAPPSRPHIAKAPHRPRDRFPWRQGGRPAGGARGPSTGGSFGFATVEIAVALPALLLVTVAALWGVTIASAQLACADAAKTGARAASRGEPLPAVELAVAQAAPAGADVRVHRDAELSTVEVTARIHAPGMTGLPPVVLHARALAATEPGAADP